MLFDKETKFSRRRKVKASTKQNKILKNVVNRIS